MANQSSPYAVAWQAVKDDDAARLVQLFNQHTDVKAWAVPAHGTWLHCAASNGSIRVFEYLLSLGMDLDAKNRDLATPLEAAAASNQLQLVGLMLERGAKISVETATSNPLFACIAGSAVDAHPVHGNGNPPTDRLIIAKLLLDAGLDPMLQYDLQAYDRMDAVAFAWMFGRQDIARLVAERIAHSDAVKVEALLQAAERLAHRATQPASDGES